MKDAARTDRGRHASHLGVQSDAHSVDEALSIDDAEIDRTVARSCQHVERRSDAVDVQLSREAVPRAAWHDSQHATAPIRTRVERRGDRAVSADACDDGLLIT